MPNPYNIQRPIERKELFPREAIIGNIIKQRGYRRHHSGEIFDDNFNIITGQINEEVDRIIKNTDTKDLLRTYVGEQSFPTELKNRIYDEVAPLSEPIATEGQLSDYKNVMQQNKDNAPPDSTLQLALNRIDLSRQIDVESKKREEETPNIAIRATEYMKKYTPSVDNIQETLEDGTRMMWHKAKSFTGNIVNYDQRRRSRREAVPLILQQPEVQKQLLSIPKDDPLHSHLRVFTPEGREEYFSKLTQFKHPTPNQLDKIYNQLSPAEQDSMLRGEFFPPIHDDGYTVKSQKPGMAVQDFEERKELAWENRMLEAITYLRNDEVGSMIWQQALAVSDAMVEKDYEELREKHRNAISEKIEDFNPVKDFLYVVTGDRKLSDKSSTLNSIIETALNTGINTGYDFLNHTVFNPDVLVSYVISAGLIPKLNQAGASFLKIPGIKSYLAANPKMNTLVSNAVNYGAGATDAFVSYMAPQMIELAIDDDKQFDWLTIGIISFLGGGLYSGIMAYNGRKAIEAFNYAVEQTGLNIRDKGYHLRDLFEHKILRQIFLDRIEETGIPVTKENIAKFSKKAVELYKTYDPSAQYTMGMQTLRRAGRAGSDTVTKIKKTIPVKKFKSGRFLRKEEYGIIDDYVNNVLLEDTNLEGMGRVIDDFNFQAGLREINNPKINSFVDTLNEVRSGRVTPLDASKKAYRLSNKDWNEFTDLIERAVIKSDDYYNQIGKNANNIINEIENSKLSRELKDGMIAKVQNELGSTTINKSPEQVAYNKRFHQALIENIMDDPDIPMKSRTMATYMIRNMDYLPNTPQTTSQLVQNEFLNTMRTVVSKGMRNVRVKEFMAFNSVADAARSTHVWGTPQAKFIEDVLVRNADPKDAIGEAIKFSTVIDPGVGPTFRIGPSEWLDNYKNGLAYYFRTILSRVNSSKFGKIVEKTGQIVDYDVFTPFKKLYKVITQTNKIAPNSNLNSVFSKAKNTMSDPEFTKFVEFTQAALRLSDTRHSLQYPTTAELSNIIDTIYKQLPEGTFRNKTDIAGKIKTVFGAIKQDQIQMSKHLDDLAMVLKKEGITIESGEGLALSKTLEGMSDHLRNPEKFYVPRVRYGGTELTIKDGDRIVFNKHFYRSEEAEQTALNFNEIIQRVKTTGQPEKINTTDLSIGGTKLNIGELTFTPTMEVKSMQIEQTSNAAAFKRNYETFTDLLNKITENDPDAMKILINMFGESFDELASKEARAGGNVFNTFTRSKGAVVWGFETGKELNNYIDLTEKLVKTVDHRAMRLRTDNILNQYVLRPINKIHKALSNLSSREMDKNTRKILRNTENTLEAIRMEISEKVDVLLSSKGPGAVEEFFNTTSFIRFITAKPLSTPISNILGSLPVSIATISKETGVSIIDASKMFIKNLYYVGSGENTKWWQRMPLIPKKSSVVYNEQTGNFVYKNFSPEVNKLMNGVRRSGLVNDRFSQSVNMEMQKSYDILGSKGAIQELIDIASSPADNIHKGKLYRKIMDQYKYMGQQLSAQFQASERGMREAGFLTFFEAMESRGAKMTADLIDQASRFVDLANGNYTQTNLPLIFSGYNGFRPVMRSTMKFGVWHLEQLNNTYNNLFGYNHFKDQSGAKTIATILGGNLLLGGLDAYSSAINVLNDAYNLAVDNGINYDFREYNIVNREDFTDRVLNEGAVKGILGYALSYATQRPVSIPSGRTAPGALSLWGVSNSIMKNTLNNISYLFSANKISTKLYMMGSLLLPSSFFVAADYIINQENVDGIPLNFGEAIITGLLSLTGLRDTHQMTSFQRNELAKQWVAGLQNKLPEHLRYFGEGIKVDTYKGYLNNLLYNEYRTNAEKMVPERRLQVEQLLSLWGFNKVEKEHLDNWIEFQSKNTTESGM